MHDYRIAAACLPLCRRRVRRRRDARAGARAREAMPRAEIDAASLGLRARMRTTISRRFYSAPSSAPPRPARCCACRREIIAPARCNCRPMPPSPASRYDAAGHGRRPVAAGVERQRSRQPQRPRPRRRYYPAARRPRACAFDEGAAMRIADCEIVDAGGNGITLEAIAGEVTAEYDRRRRGQCHFFQ